MSELLEGKSIIVTGAGSGIGRATALVLAREGARVVASDLNGDAAQITADAIGAAGGIALPLRVDVTRAEEQALLVETAVSRYGRLDGAFNNAGIPGEGALLADWSDAGFDAVINVNLKAVWLGMKLQIRQMLSQPGGGAIVNTASVGGLVGKAHLSVYCASKHGVIGLTKCAALEYGSRGVRVNAVCPGVIHTDMVEQVVGRDPAALAEWSRLQPIGRMGTPAEIGEAVAWLLSDRASLVHGHAFPVDGGLVAA